MKKIIMISICLCMMVSMNNKASAQSSGDAVIYMDEVLSSIEEFKNETWAYLKSVTRGQSARRVEKKRQKLISQVKSVRKTISKLDGFNGDESLKEAMFEYIDITYSVLKEDYDKILDMEEIAAQSYDMMEAYITAQEMADDKMEEASDKLSMAQKTFAANNNINLIDGELDKKGEKIKKAGAAVEYYNDIFLLQFKCSVQESYVLDALSRNDVSGIEQNKSAMESFINENRSILDTFPAHNDDKALIDATLILMDFYEKEVNEYFSEVTNYYIEKENFERVQEQFRAISESNRTQEDVDKFNAAVNKYNAAINEFNAILDTSNRERSKAVNKWNKSVSDFLDTHSR